MNVKNRAAIIVWRVDRQRFVQNHIAKRWPVTEIRLEKCFTVFVETVERFRLKSLKIVDAEESKIWGSPPWQTQIYYVSESMQHLHKRIL